MQAHHTCLQTPSSSTLDALNEDVLKLIVDRLHPAALRNLASSSHKLRDICLPVLFSRCTVDIKRHRIGYSSLPGEVRVRVRHLTHLGPLGEEQDVEYFEALLDHLPAVQSVTIKNAAGQIPWGIWKACISRPHIESFSYDARRYDLAIPPFPSDEVETTCVFLQKFSYTTSIWRELINSAGGLRHLRRRPIDMQRVLEFERQCLSPIVLKMSKTAVSFTLPLESTPVSAMAKLPWPNLKELNLHGRFLEAAQVKQIQHLLLQSLPSLARLSILAARTSEVGRPPFLPHPASNTSGSSSEPLFSQLRALEIAYFDPMDGMFSIPMPMLSHLALRDYPRVHHNYGHGLPVGEGSRQHLHTPLLLDSEILYILRRMQLPLLTSLEIVYGVTDEVSDNELLSYIVDAFPHLEHLEIHRYRRRRNTC